MNFKNILVEKQGHVGFITLNQPASLNVITSAMVSEIEQAVLTFEEDEFVSVIVLKGSDEAFSSGLNLEEIENESYAHLLKTPFFDKKWNALLEAKKPIIGVASGYTLGMGFDILLMCDLILASDTAVFGYPEISIALVSGVGGMKRLKNRIGLARSSDMLYTGKLISADTALEYGLVSRVIPLSLLGKEVSETAKRISSFSSPVLRLIKRELTRNEPSLDDSAFNTCFSLEDTLEGIKAGIEKRTPQFKNK